MTMMNLKAFEQMIAADLDWLLRQPRSLERDHIRRILEDAAEQYYPSTEIRAVDLCPWWKRLYHSRLRAADLTGVWVALIAKAKTQAEARRAWALHLSMPGQEHWHCGCGLETQRTIAAVNFRVDADPEAS